MPAAPGGAAPSATFDWQGHPLELLAAKAVWDPQRQVLLVADLHLGKAETFQVHGIPAVTVAEEPVSSTRVRLAVERGDFPAAARLLGRDYSVHGTIVQGRQLARKLGFPTANLSLEAEQLPPIGVYAVRVTVAGKSCKGVANLGLRPTVEDGTAKRQLEVHLFDHTGDLYGQGIEVRFIQRLRDEMKMDSLEALKAQIALDAAQARSVLG